MIKINLLAPELIKKEEKNEILIIGYLIIGILFLIGLGNYWNKLRSFNKLEARLTLSKSELSKYESIVKQVEALQGTKNVLETKKNVINSLMINRLLYPKFMEDLVNLLPSNVWLKTLATQLQNDGKMSVAVDAEALDNYAIADFVTALLSNKDILNTELGTISSAASTKAVTSMFHLTFIYQKRKQ